MIEINNERENIDNIDDMIFDLGPDTAKQFSEAGFDIKNIEIINNSPDKMIFNKSPHNIFDNFHKLQG